VEIQFSVDGRQVSVPDDGASLLEALRDRLGVRSPKDGCSPQGQCGCCTVWVDGAPRVACVTPARRIAGREVTTVAGLDPAVRDRWANAFVATGGSQCGFCTPGIIMRLAAQRGSVDNALLAHLCRCTGWRTVLEAADLATSDRPLPGASRDFAAAARRAELEGGVPQHIGPDVALGEGGFADDSAPLDALVALPTETGDWVVRETLLEARVAAGKIQGRRTTLEPRWPVDLPPGDWAVALQTTWTEPAYLETDASWCLPGGEPASPLANGGAFGGKSSSAVQAVARRLADEHGRAVRVLLTREDTVRLGPKRPPLAVGVRRDGSGTIRAARTDGLAELLALEAPGFELEEVDLTGPPTSTAIRGAGWLEAVVVAAAAREETRVRAPGGGAANARFDVDGTLNVSVACGDPLDEVVLRSYCTGAAHMGLGLVRSEVIAVDDEGRPHDLTIRSFGILRAIDTPEIRIEVETSDGPPVNGSDAVMAAVALAAWRADGLPPRWPTDLGEGAAGPSPRVQS
jgi:aerobic-type carbon monoxide dehydrogenase small subunit (CoxS/CutS family)